MIHFFGHTKDGRMLRESSASAVDFPAGVLEEAQVGWVDVVDPSPADLAWLGRQFRFHPLALEDCAHFDQRPKVEQYQDHLFIVVHGLRQRKDCPLEVYELHCFLSNHVVVTVHEGDAEPLIQLSNRIARDSAQLPTQVDFLLHRVLDVVMDANPQSLRKIEGEIETLDVQILEQAKTLHIERILEIQQQLNSVRYTLSPQREIFASLASRNWPQISERAALYFRDVFDHLIRVNQLVDELRENLWAIRDAHLSLAAYRTNEAMKRLTVFSVVFLPLTFITGFFGMNFEHIPWTHDGFFWVIVVLILSLPVLMLFWFNRKDWL